MKKFISNYFYKKFQKEIKDHYIEQQLPLYPLKATDKKVMESLAGLYEDEGWKTLIRLWCNRKNSLGQELLRKETTGKYQDAYLRGFYRGQSYFISHTIALIRHIHNKWQQEENKKGEK